MLVLLAVAATACGDDELPVLPCDGACGPDEFCNNETCEPLNPDTGVDAGNPDVDEDPVEDPGVEEPDTQGGDVPVDDGTSDPIEDVPDPGSDPEVGTDPEVVEEPDDPDVGADPDVDSDSETGIDPDTSDVEPDDGGIGPREICPLDHLETELSNNSSLTASELHSTLLVATSGTRGTGARDRDLCDEDLAFTSLGTPADDQCVDALIDDGGTKDHLGRCECMNVTELGACSVDATSYPGDIDWHMFQLLKGDRAWVRVIFANDPPPLGVALVDVAEPPREAQPCASDGQCGTGLCVGGNCRPTVSGGRWTDADLDGTTETFELDLGQALPAEGSSTVLGEYFIRVWSIGGTMPTPDLPYEILIQVTPDNRLCLHDTWDEDWSTYRVPCAAGDATCIESSEDRCNKPSCTLPIVPVKKYNICTWDRQDWFRYYVSGGESTQRVIVDWSTDTDIGRAQLWQMGGAEPVCKGELTARGTILEADFTGLANGEYQLRVWNDVPSQYEVSIAPSDGTAAPPTGTCPP